MKLKETEMNGHRAGFPHNVQLWLDKGNGTGNPLGSAVGAGFLCERV